eukprot:CAMPEP_0177579576 /NCGR_PEP_ID=MMETSP0419_2-20121207/1039_1 /TAXON_ID=582737 /ORGANISM="Tetraselmis sp., Strain GSL018" /LENGTH=129 /DNA_ID=CAMNT_0019068263 /DNA_START=500 /DNA_END=890 /DNA_ORIENTATION=+
MKSLQRLWLDRNRLAQLPREMANLDQLQELYLEDNCLASLPEELEGCKSLRKLFINGNPDLAACPMIERMRERAGCLETIACAVVVLGFRDERGAARRALSSAQFVAYNVTFFSERSSCCQLDTGPSNV